MELLKPDIELKIVMLGPTGVDKTNLVLRYTENRYVDPLLPTIGCNIFTKTLKIEGHNVKVNIWDTSGQESFQDASSKLFYCGSAGALLVYNTENRYSFDSIPKFLQRFRAKAPENAVVMLVGNQLWDSPEQRVVSTDEGIEFSNSNNLLFMETSARNSINVDEAFITLITEIIHRLQNTGNIQSNQVDEVPQQSPPIEKKKVGFFSSLFTKKKTETSQTVPQTEEINSLKSQLSEKDKEIDQLKKYISVLKEKSHDMKLVDNDEYEEGQILGEGATSVVQKVAMKKPQEYAKKELTRFDHKTLQRFLQEAEFLFKLRHPCIVRIFGFNYGDDQHPPSIFLSLEPNSLESSIRNHQLNNNEKNRIIVEIVLGMRYIHSNNLMHRDLKPENILLSRNKHVRISDFGLAKEESLETSQSKGVGTLRFMAPELLREEADYTNKVDVYAFGITLIFILMNEYPPFNLLDVASGKFPELPSTTVEWVIDLIHRCLSVSPEDRLSFAEIFEILKSHNFDIFTSPSSQQQNFNQEIQHRILKIEAFEYQLQQKPTQNK